MRWLVVVLPFVFACASAPPAAPSRVPSGDAYVPLVRKSNVAPLPKAAFVPFAKYINSIHERLHPLVAQVIESPERRALVDEDRSVALELVLRKEDGSISQIGIIKSSGEPAFDQAVLDAAKRSAPFGRAPEVIASPDGRVYIHWLIHSDPYEACRADNASPFLLRAQ